jgi:tetratricopeptide (TPR) repeat protein
LAGGLSLPRRQRLHLRIADALERPGAPPAEASVLAHHLYQAGAAADTQRTAIALAAAGRAALAAGAFEDALAWWDHVLGLELLADDPLMAEAHEHRGDALNGLQRLDEAAVAFDRALGFYTDRREDGGIDRSARRLSEVFLLRLQLQEASACVGRALRALSDQADRERVRLLARKALFEALTSHFDDAWATVQRAEQVAERVGDPDLLRSVLLSQGFCHRYSAEPLPAIELFRRTLTLMPAAALWDRAEVLGHLVTLNSAVGRLGDSEGLLPDLATCAGRAGHQLGIYVHGLTVAAIALMRSGNLRSFRAQLDAIRSPVLSSITRAGTATASLYLGDSDAALRAFAEMVEERSASAGMASPAFLFAAAALAGQRDRARALVSAIEAWLPVQGRRNPTWAFSMLEAFVAGLAILNDRDTCGRLYPLTLDDIQTGIVWNPIGHVGPQLGAALAADAAGLPDRAREHFEIAATQARDIPIRLLQPTVLYWHGRFLAAQREVAEPSRGRAMVQAALEDFRSLEMVLHADLAERFLREGAV